MSLSTELAEFVAQLTYERLPAAVIDRTKAVTFQNITSALMALDKPGTRNALALVTGEEETGRFRLLGRRETFSKAAAAYVNAETIFAGGKWDTFRMLMHPGICILPAALAAAEANASTGAEFITAVAAGYEVMERMAGEFIPSVMARGFHVSPVFGIFGAAITAAKLHRLDADRISTVIAQCANLASGNLEGLRTVGTALREGGAVRNGLLAVALARNGAQGAESALEGEAGFYHAYTGNNLGRLSYSFTAKTRAELADITKDLGQDWIFLETLFRIYAISGYNIAHVEVTAQLCARHGIKAADIDHIDAVVNWMETVYPSPAFPSRGIDNPPKPESTQYFTAYGAVTGAFPILRPRRRTAADVDPPEVLELMHRVTLIPQVDRALFGPRITIVTKDGHSFTQEGTGREFIFDYEALVGRMRGVAPALLISPTRFDAFIDAVRNLERYESASDTLFAATMPG